MKKFGFFVNAKALTLTILALALVVGLTFVSCGNGTTNNDGGDGTTDGGDNQDVDSTTDEGGAFVAVTGITGVPTTGTAGTRLTLRGTVVPANATNKTIVWTVANAGTTGATISENTLSATAAGTATVRATIANGTAPGTAFTRDFVVTIAAAGSAVQGNFYNDVNGDGSVFWFLTLSGSNFSFFLIYQSETMEVYNGAFTVSGNSVACTITNVNPRHYAIANAGEVKIFTIIDENTLYISQQSLGHDGFGYYRRGQPPTIGPGTSIPAAPTGVTATRNQTTPTTVTVRWNAVSGAAGYRVYYSNTGSDSGTQVGSPTTTSFNRSNNSIAATHYFRVSAVNSAGEGATSSWVSVGPVEGVTGGVSYTAVANNTDNTTAIIFTFNDAITNLTATDITITEGTGSATKGALSGSGTSWSLAVTVVTAGDVTVSINRAGIESGSKTVAVYKVVPAEQLFGSWVSTTGRYQPYNLYISADTIRVSDSDGTDTLVVRYSNVQWTPAVNSNDEYQTNYPAGYTFSGSQTLSYLGYPNHIFEMSAYSRYAFSFIALSLDGNSVYVGKSDSSFGNMGGPIYTKRQ